MDLLSLVIGFVVGAFTGAAGQYLGEKYTDKRRKIEQASEDDQVWNDLVTRFPKIIGEMKEDARNPDLLSAREFFVKSSKTTVNRSKPSFEYHTDVHADLHAAIAHLERLGYIEDITPGNCPMYRMTEDFIDRLRNA
ncbi:MAG: hypothetical protein Q8K46_01725 [Deltaproteobacteria bacterium]|nr:hypothetical protein [Deltaproteobacteria bacterium]